jgi:NitT/TauT family transport system permease protein
MGNGAKLKELQKPYMPKSKAALVEDKLFGLGQFLFPFLVIGIFWEISVRMGIVDAHTLPAPSMILHEFYSLVWQKGALQRHLFHSLYRLFTGYILAVAIGVVAGTVLGLHRTTREMFSPALSLLISVPTIAWIPVLLITMGLGEKTVITAIFLGGVFEITYSTIAGIRSVDRQQINAARIMGVKGSGLFCKVLLPGSLIYVMPALRLSIGYCWRALVGGEMLSAMIKWGIGKMIYEARFWNDIKVMFAGLIMIGILGVLLDRTLLKKIEQETLEKWGMLAER